MAVAVLTTATTSTNASGASPYTALTHTCTAGSNRLLLLFIGIGLSPGAKYATNTPTYGGQSMTRIGSGATDSNFVSMDIWYLKEAGIAAAGTTTFSFTHAGSEIIGVGAACLSGVDQTTPIDTGSVQTTGASGTTATVTISIASGNLGVAGLMSDAEAGVTENRTALYETGAINSDCVAAAQTTTTSGSVAMTWTQASTGYTALGFEVNADAGGGGGTVGGPVFDGRTFRGLTAGRVLG
jgi:hypothetical protein